MPNSEKNPERSVATKLIVVTQLTKQSYPNAAHSPLHPDCAYA